MHFRETKEICGSDGLTYGSPCQLNEESARREASPNLPVLSMEYWGPCKEAPAIISPPSDTYGPIGANLTLDCEARGYPAPTISWQVCRQWYPVPTIFWQLFGQGISCTHHILAGM